MTMNLQDAAAKGPAPYRRPWREYAGDLRRLALTALAAAAAVALVASVAFAEGNHNGGPANPGSRVNTNPQNMSDLQRSYQIVCGSSWCSATGYAAEVNKGYRVQAPSWSEAWGGMLNAIGWGTDITDGGYANAVGSGGYGGWRW